MNSPYLYGLIDSNAWQSYVLWISVCVMFGCIARWFDGRSKREQR